MGACLVFIVFKQTGLMQKETDLWFVDLDKFDLQGGQDVGSSFSLGVIWCQITVPVCGQLLGSSSSSLSFLSAPCSTAFTALILPRCQGQAQSWWAPVLLVKAAHCLVEPLPTPCPGRVGGLGGQGLVSPVLCRALNNTCLHSPAEWSEKCKCQAYFEVLSSRSNGSPARLVLLTLTTADMLL